MATINESHAPAEPDIAGAISAGANVSGGGAVEADTLPRRVFAVLDRAGIPYCALHGYDDGRDHHGTSADVDCLIPSDIAPARIARTLWDAKAWIGAEPVQWLRGATQFIVLAGREPDGSLTFLHLHITPSYDLRRRTYFTADEILAGRRRRGPFWVPAAPTEFACGLARRIAKGELDEHHGRALKALYDEDPAGCARQVERIWGAARAPLLLTAAASGNWDPVRRAMPRLRTTQRRRASLRHPLRLLGGMVVGAARVARRWVAADRGLSMIFLGPDGAGKSSVAGSMRDALSLAFVETERRTFPPRILDRSCSGKTNSTPHGTAQRSWAASVTRALGYWLVYYGLVRRFTSRRTLMRHALVIYDRHPIDALVDRRRYRYTGPRWVLRLIRRLIPDVDLVILLDAPPHVIQTRKQEVPPEETARQIKAYRTLVEPMPNGRVLDANRPLAEITRELQDIVLQFMSERIARRFGLIVTHATPAHARTTDSSFASTGRLAWVSEFLTAIGAGDGTDTFSGVRGLGDVPDVGERQGFVALNGQDLPDDVLNAAGFSYVRRFAVLPSAKDPRWLIPLQTPVVAAAGFCMCNPFRAGARLKRNAARAMAWLGMPMWYRDQICIAQRVPPALEDVLAQSFGGKPLHLSFSLGSPPPARNPKISLAAMDGRGRVLGFGKLPGTQSVALHSVRREGEMLAALGTFTPPIGAPRLIHAGPVGASHLALAAPLAGRPPGLDLTDVHQRYLASLRRGPMKPATETALYAALRERAVTFRDRPAVTEALARLEPILRDSVVPSTVFHGDFTPWNLRVQDGEIAALDWEYGEVDGLPLLDETRHTLTVGYLMRRWTVGEAHDALMRLAADAPLGLRPPQAIALQMFDILHYILKALHEGHDDDYPRLVWCRAILTRAGAALDDAMRKEAVQ